MTNNPYQAPAADLAILETGPQRPVLGLVTGLAVDLGGTLVLSIVSAVAFAFLMALQGYNESAITQALSNVGLWSTYGMVTTILGLGLSFAGGYACIRVARARTLKLAGIQALVVTAVAILLSLDAPDLKALAILVPATIAAVLTGARLALPRHGAVGRDHQTPSS